MAIYSKERNFIFVHPYKCAGTSFRTILQSQIPDCEERWNTHATAEEAKYSFAVEDNMGAWDKSFKFVFVRNPFDWIVSLYEYIRMHDDHPQHYEVKDLIFSEFVKYNIDCILKSVQNDNGKYNTLYGFLHDLNGVMLVDYIGKVETFDEDCKYIFSKIGIKKVRIRHDNKSNREPDYQKYYDEETRQLVENFFKKDLETFNYKF